jgi:ribosome biogenesis GTPase
MMDAIDFEALLGLGLGAAMRAQLACGVADPAARPMRLVEVQREHLVLHDGRALRRARASAVLTQDLTRQDETLAVGDWVLARPGASGGPAGPAGCGDPGTWVVTCRLLPHSQITRRTNDGRGGVQRQVLVSNVDTALLVMGLDFDFNLRRLERYLALVRLAAVDAVLVLSKADTLAPGQPDQRLAQVAAVLPPGMAAMALDLRQGAAAAALAPWLQRGRTLVLLGSSGAGKSTLANTLANTLTSTPTCVPIGALATLARRDTGPVRTDDSRGRHTTTVRSLLPLPGGACIIDTPGLRALRLDVDDAGQLADAFGDVARWAPACRFRDCQHRLEPGCAVRQSLPEARLRNYHKLLREAGRDALSVQQRQTQLTQWKARSRHAQLRLRAKRDGAG